MGFHNVCSLSEFWRNGVGEDLIFCSGLVDYEGVRRYLDQCPFGLFILIDALIASPELHLIILVAHRNMASVITIRTL